MNQLSNGWLVMAVGASLLGACSGSGGSKRADAGGGDNAAGAAQSLANALQFENEGAATISGGLPQASPGAPELAGGGDMGGTLTPGGTGSVRIQVADEDPADPVVASLVYFEGASSFISLPVGGATKEQDGTVVNTFTVSDAVCKDLCNIVHQVKCYEAAQTSSGLVTAANLQTVLLECTGSGDPARCGDAQPQPDAGGTDTGQGQQIDHGTTWTDPATGLTWQTPPMTFESGGRSFTWTGADAYCKGLDLDGTGWRLATIDELRSVIRGCDESAAEGSCDLQACTADKGSEGLFDQAPCCNCSYGSGPAGDPSTGYGCYWPDAFGTQCRNRFWSATPAGNNFQGEPGYWTVEFGRASPEAALADSHTRTFCVR